MAGAQKILVVGPAWVGDMVMAQSLFITLRERHPDAVIDVVAPQWSLPLLERMPQVRRGIALPIGHGEFGLGARWRIGRELRGEGYEQAIVLPRSLKAALVPFFAGAKRRTGYRGEMRYGLLNDIRPLDKSLLTQTVQRFTALGLEPGEALPPPVAQPKIEIDRVNQQACLERLQLSLEKPVIGLLPGAEYGPAKQWPAQYYGELAAKLAGQGYQVWQFGSAKDRQAAEEIDLASGGCTTILCGETSLVDAIDLIAACRAVVSNDSGLMHIAAAVGTPLVAIYGSSTPDYTPPLSEQAEVCYLGLECSPCFKRECPKQSTECLYDITQEQVTAALQRLLNRE